MTVPPEIIVDWIRKKKYIQDRLNRIRKRIKKLEKQINHFEFRLQIIKKHCIKNEKNIKKASSCKRDNI